MREWTQGIKGGPDHYWGAFSLPNILLANSSLFTSQNKLTENSEITELELGATNTVRAF